MEYKTPKDQLKFECDYQILNRTIEIEILNARLTKLKTQLFTEENKKLIAELNATIMELDRSIKLCQAEISYYQEKIDRLAKIK